MKILIVDDKTNNALLLEILLKEEGWQTVRASDGEEALEKLRDGNFDLIISDILMPVMDGFALCKIVNEDDRLKDIPFIFLTETFKSREDESLALKVGADAFRIRPMDPTLLIDIIKHDIMMIRIRRSLKSKKKVRSENEKDIYRLYNARLVKKLEHKVSELENLNRENRILLSEIFSLTKDNIASVSERIYQLRNLSETDLGNHIDILCGTLLKGYGINPAEISVKLIYDNIIFVSPETAVCCGLIISELMSDRLKHAILKDKSGEIEIELCMTDENEIGLYFRDNGIGVSEDSDFDSFGLQFITGLVEYQLCGEMELSSDKGTNLRIKFENM
ncbi:response regulator [Desulfobacterales bacterium HSG2]|nr:response regulator [Desulfobacterales bacterium HSG2]